MAQRRILGFLLLAAVGLASCSDSDSGTSNRRAGAPLLEGESAHAADVLGRLRNDFRIAPRAGQVDLVMLRRRKESVPFLPLGSARGFVQE